MQVQQFSETRLPLVFDTKLEVIPGGITVAVADLSQDTVYAGTPVGKDANGLYHVIKHAVLNVNASATDTNYQVKKGHNLKQGDFFGSGVGSNAQAITGINASNANYDVVTLGATLGVALTAGETMVQAKAVGNNSVLPYEPVGLIGTTFNIVPGDNHLTDCVVRGSVRSGALQMPIDSTIQGKMPLIRF